MCWVRGYDINERCVQSLVLRVCLGMLPLRLVNRRPSGVATCALRQLRSFVALSHQDLGHTLDDIRKSKVNLISI